MCIVFSCTSELVAQSVMSDDGPTGMVRQSCLPRRHGKKGFDELETFLPLRPPFLGWKDGAV